MAQSIFERIAQTETDQWVPLYHAANILISGSFSQTDMEVRETMLTKAQELIALGHERSPNNAELLTLEGLLYTSYLAADPQTYGMMYSPKVAALNERALAAAPANPRAMLNKVEFDMGTARFFGHDLAPLCEQAKAAIIAFENYKSEVPFAPTHGQDRAEQIVKTCNE